MSIVALTADWHIRGKDMNETIAQLDRMNMVMKHHGVENVYHAGDFFDNPQIGDTHVSTGQMIYAMHCLFRYWDADITVAVGNHDLRHGHVPAPRALQFYDPIIAVAEPRWIEDTGVNVYCLPWSWRAENPEEIITRDMAKAPKNGLPKLFLSHIKVINASLRNGVFHEGNGGWETTPEFLASLPFDRFALGDFHRRQEIVPGRGGYVGALRQLNFGEEGNPAGFELWNTETGESQWVELDDAPKYFTVSAKVEDAEELSNNNSWIGKMKFRFDGEVAPRYVRALEAKGHRVELPAIEKTERESRVEALPPGILNDPAALLEVWAKAQNPPMPPERIAKLRDRLNQILSPATVEVAS